MPRPTRLLALAVAAPLLLAACSADDGGADGDGGSKDSDLQFSVVTHGSEVLELIAAAGEHLVEEPRGEERPRDALSSVERQVLEWVPVSTPAEVGSIARLSSLHVRDTVGALRRLQDKRFVRFEEGGWRLAPDV